MAATPADRARARFALLLAAIAAVLPTLAGFAAPVVQRMAGGGAGGEVLAWSRHGQVALLVLAALVLAGALRSLAWRSTLAFAGVGVAIVAFAPVAARHAGYRPLALDLAMTALVALGLLALRRFQHD
jgi:hypothetical protein